MYGSNLIAINVLKAVNCSQM